MMRAVLVGALIALAVIVSGAREVRAQAGGVAWMQYEASYVHAGCRDGGGDLCGLGLGGVRLGGLVGRDHGRVGYVVNLDLLAGATRPAGFAWQVDLYVLGAGLRLGRSGMLAVAGGIGGSGATTMADGADLPVQATLQLALGARLRLLARGRIVWLTTGPERQGGAPSLGPADALDGAIALRFGRRYHAWGAPSGNGYFAGVAYRESEGGRFVGAIIGYAVDIGTPR